MGVISLVTKLEKIIISNEDSLLFKVDIFE